MLIDVGNKFYRLLYFIISIRLKRKGYSCYFLFKNTSFDLRSDTLIYNNFKLSNSLYQKTRFLETIGKLPPEKYRPRYKIDLENKKIIIGELNFFDLIEACLRPKYKIYSIDYSNDTVISEINKMVESCRLIVGYFLMIREYQKENNCNIKFVAKENIYIPASVFRMLCAFYNNENSLEYIGLARGYPSYLMKKHFRYPFLVLNNFSRTKVHQSIAIIESDFRRFKTECSPKLISDILDYETKLLKSQKQTNTRNINYTNNDSYTFLMLPHLFYDVEVDDSSSVFDGMDNWILKTVEFFMVNQNMRLLIKPHPTEFLYHGEESKKPNETIFSLLKEITITENIEILDNNLSIADYSDKIDCGLVWRSTAGLELTLNDVPIIISGMPYYKIILSEEQANSREDYFSRIKQFEEKTVDRDNKIDAALYLHYLRNYKHFDLNIADYKIKTNSMVWHKEGIIKCIEGVNPHFNIMIDRLIE